MGGGIFQQFDLVEGAGDNSALANHHCADRYFLRIVSAHGLPERFAHEIVVALQVNNGLFRHGALLFLWLPSLGRRGSFVRTRTTVRRRVGGCSPLTSSGLFHRTGNGNERRRNLRDGARTRARSVRGRSAAALRRTAPCARRI